MLHFVQYRVHNLRFPGIVGFILQHFCKRTIIEHNETSQTSALYILPQGVILPFPFFVLAYVKPSGQIPAEVSWDAVYGPIEHGRERFKRWIGHSNPPLMVPGTKLLNIKLLNGKCESESRGTGPLTHSLTPRYLFHQLLSLSLLLV